MEIQVNDIVHKVKRNTILRGVSFTLNEGIYGLLGPNGAGKTTLMRILTDVLIPSSGEIWFDGEHKDKMGDRYRAQLGYLPQELGMYGHFKGREFLHFVAALKGMDKSNAALEIDRLAEIMNLSDVLDQKCGKYSGGMKRRLGIIQSLLNRPKILVLDEPTVGLDPVERVRFRNMLTELASDRIIILSTHIVSDIDHIANQILMMKEGQILRQGTIPDIAGELDGRVWEGHLPNRQLGQVERQGTIVSMQQTTNGLDIRIVSEHQPFDRAVQVQPSLEDVYMYGYHPFQLKNNKRR